jgi:Domain of unknown function (DUF4919)
MRKVLPFLFICLFVPLSLAAAPPQTPTPQPTPTPTPAANKDDYETLLARVQKGDRTVDFKALRFAYTETKAYNPYNSDSDARKAMFAALNSKEFDKVLAQAEKILSRNYVDINAHFGAYVAHKELQHAEQAALHKFIVDGLLKSITSSGDGKTAATAFVVISTDEEYALFNFAGLRPTQQALVNENGHAYDKMTAVDPETNQTVIYFFNIDKPFGWLAHSLSH